MATDTLTFKRGDTWKLYLTEQDFFAPLADLSTASATLQVRHKRSNILLAEADSSTGGIVLHDVSKTAVIVLVSAITELLEPGLHEFDLEIVYTDGSVQSSKTFDLRVEKDITYVNS